MSLFKLSAVYNIEFSYGSDIISWFSFFLFSFE